MNLTRFIFPPERRRLPHARACNIAARTVHLAATGVLLGAHVFGAPAERLWPYLWTAVASGAVMLAIEIYPAGHWLHQGAALFVYTKLGLLCLIPVWWRWRVPLLLAVVVLASVGSHAPRRLRHYSVVFKRVMTE